MLHRLAIDGIADHFDEGCDRRIFRDEAVVPAFLRRADQHQLEPSLPDDPPAEPFEHRPALAAISRIGFRPGCLASIRIGGLHAQPYQVEHVNRAFAIVLAELSEYFLGRIDMAHAVLPSVPGVLARLALAPNPALTSR